MSLRCRAVGETRDPASGCATASSHRQLAMAQSLQPSIHDRHTSTQKVMLGAIGSRRPQPSQPRTILSAQRLKRRDELNTIPINSLQIPRPQSSKKPVLTREQRRRETRRRQTIEQTDIRSQVSQTRRCRGHPSACPRHHHTPRLKQRTPKPKRAPYHDTPKRRELWRTARWFGHDLASREPRRERRPRAASRSRSRR